jgi:hypothetical protein
MSYKRNAVRDGAHIEGSSAGARCYQSVGFMGNTLQGCSTIGVTAADRALIWEQT